MHNVTPRARQAGTSLIEVLVTVVILGYGLLGLNGLLVRAHVAEMESYQRAQALLLLKDMANRIGANRSQADTYVTSTPLGTGMDCPTAAVATRQQFDSQEWCHALQGAAEAQGGTRVGAMLGGRGCVERLGSGEYRVTVAWQGLGALSAPPAGLGCASHLYDQGTICVDDRCRRTLTTVVRIAAMP